MSSERRRSRRYPCNGFAEVVVPRANLLFRGQIRNVSESGCFVATMLQHNVDLDCEALLRFTLKGHHFQTEALVANFLQGKGVGLRFLSFDGEAKMKLAALCQTLGEGPSTK